MGNERPNKRLVVSYIGFIGLGIWGDKRMQLAGISLPFVSIEYYWGPMIKEGE